MNSKRQHATSGEILRGAARRLTASKFGLTDGDEACGNAEKKILCRNIENVNKIWRAVALVIGSSLLSNAARGVRIESLGTFALDAKDRERFFLASEFVARHRLLKYDACTGGSLAGGSVNTRLNISRVAATAGSPRPDAERVLDAVLRSLRQCLASGKSVTLSFHPVAEFSCVPSRQSRMRYLPGFRARKKAVAAAVTRGRVGVGRAKSKPTPWAAASSNHMDTGVAVGTAAVASTGESRKTITTAVANSRVVVRSAPVVGHSLARGTAAALRTGRPLSASMSVSASASKTNCIVPHRSKSSHGGGGRGIRANTDSGPGGSTLRVAAESGVGTATTQPISAWESPRTSRRVENFADLTTAHNSCASLGSGVFRGDPRNARCVKNSGRGGKERRDAAAIYRCNGHGHLQEEEWLASLLRQQTIAQTGREGLRRLMRILRLSHAGVRDRDGRLSGRSLVQALRNVDVALTPGELEEMTSVFRRQRDGRVPLQVLLAAMECEGSPIPSVEKASELSPAPICGWREGGRQSGGSPCDIRRARDGKVTAMPRPEGSSTPSSGQGDDALSSPPCNALRSPQGAAELLARAGEHSEPQGRREVDKRHGDGGYRDEFGSHHGQRRPSASQHDNIPDKSMLLKVNVPAMMRLRRECWHSNGGGGGSEGKASAEERAIADLATIVYHPPRSLERLIHVLQASKVTEQPAIACAAMSARLCQLCPGLGRTRAKALATAAACGRLDEKVCLVQLHALLERRFGRNGFAPTATATERNIPTRFVASSSTSLSCAAVERVRRNLLSGKGGLRGLKGALFKPGASMEGSLTKEELRRALITAGGPGCPPPTAKDIDDLFTLFSCQTSAGVNGGRVEATTVLRSLRGDLSPARESVVRDVFRSLLNLSRSGHAVHDGVGAPSDRDLVCSKTRRNVGTKRAMNDAVQVEDLKNAYCKGVGRRFSLVNDNTVPSCDRGNKSVGGWFFDWLRSDDESPRTPRFEGNTGGVGWKANNKWVTVEQFLEYYRDVSTGIDGDDAFEAFVRGSWSMRPLAHPGQNNGTASERGRGIAEGAGGSGRKSRTAPAWYGNDGSVGNRSPDMKAQPISRTVGVSLSARTGVTAPGLHHRSPRGKKTGESPATGSPCATTVAHRANYLAPAVSRTGVSPRSVSTMPGARLPGRNQYCTRATNAGSVHEVEGSPVRPLTAARRDADDICKEGSSNRVGATKSHAKERRGVGGAHHRRRPATHQARWVPGDEELGDGSSSHKSRQKRVPQRRTHHERGPGRGQTEELKGYRVEPAAYEFEQQQVGTDGFGVTAIPVAAADLSVRQRHQPPVGIATERVNKVHHDFESNEGVDQNPKNSRVPSTINDENQAGKSDALVHGRGCHGSGISFDRSAAAVRVQRVFRGHKGRRCAGAEGRKRASQRASEREARMERERPHAVSHRLSGRLPRPKLPSTYGF